VRRGRIKGFIPWLITQRPAVLSKNVLSQADGLIAMKLTASQDRAALGDWIEGQADRAQGKKILGEMPALERGTGVIWIPGRGVLETAAFPKKTTFDSSRTPTRGEVKRTIELKPLDLGALRDKLAKLETEAKANDPRALNAQIKELTRKLAAAEASAKAPAPSAVAADAIRAKAFAEGAASRDHDVEVAYSQGVEAAIEKTQAALSSVIGALPKPKPPKPVRAPAEVRALAPPPTPRAPAPKAVAPVSGLTQPQTRILEALAFWESLEIENPTRDQIGAAAGYSPSSGNFGNLLGQLRAMGLVDYPQPNRVCLTDDGRNAAPYGGDAVPVRDRLAKILSNPQARLLDALPTDGEAMTREALGEATGYSHTSGNFGNLIGQLHSLGLVTYPSKGMVAVEPWVWS